MAEFLQLPIEDQQDVLAAIAIKLGRPAQLLLKDVWLCWALNALFARPREVRMVFKGGTSLSKVFACIDRFSEDIDLSLDYRDLGVPMPGDIHTEALSRSKKDRIRNDLSATARSYVRQRIHPPLREAFLDITAGLGRTSLHEDGDLLRLHYPTGTNMNSHYIEDAVLLEFGGRNVTEPNGPHRIMPILAAQLPDLAFPAAEVTVLAPERTFWEKATLIHAECNRNRAHGSDRICRHWYDLAMLNRSGIGQRAQDDRTLLEDVVLHKSIFFHAAYARYEDCLAGKLRLVPEEPLRGYLHRDYRAMQSAGMFEGAVPHFNVLVEELQILEESIND